jgi:hypothetical protein
LTYPRRSRCTAAGLALDAAAPPHCDNHSANAASMLMELSSLGGFVDLNKFIQAPSVVIHFPNCCYIEYPWINRSARIALMRLFVVLSCFDSLGQRCGPETDGLQRLFIFVVLDVWGWVVAVFAGLGLDRFQFACFAGVA